MIEDYYAYINKMLSEGDYVRASTGYADWVKKGGIYD